MTRHDPPYVFFPGPVPGVSQTEGKAYYDVLRVEPAVEDSFDVFEGSFVLCQKGSSKPFVLCIEKHGMYVSYNGGIESRVISGQVFKQRENSIENTTKKFRTLSPFKKFFHQGRRSTNQISRIRRNGTRFHCSDDGAFAKC